MDKNSRQKQKQLKKHEVIILIAVLIAGILIGRFVLAGTAVRNQCNDGIDNDGDGLIDYPADPGCNGKTDKSELNPNVECDDGIDNDRDGFIDYPKDSGCSSLTDISERGYTQCDDGIDNDKDGKIDYPSDPGCSSPSDNSEVDVISSQCNDGIDNDADGLIDYPNDPGCSSSSDNDENNCGNAICDIPYENPGNCYADCPSVCGDNLCTNYEDATSCYNDCRYIKFGEGLSTTIKSVRLPGATTFTNITKFREVDANGVSTGNEALAIHKLRTYYEYYDPLHPFNANVTSDDPWVLRLVTLQYDSSYQKYKAANPYHYFIINFDYTNLSLKNCVQTDGYFDGKKVRVRSKNFLNDNDNTCPLCGDGVCESGESHASCPLDC